MPEAPPPPTERRKRAATPTNASRERWRGATCRRGGSAAGTGGQAEQQALVRRQGAERPRGIHQGSHRAPRQDRGAGRVLTARSSSRSSSVTEMRNGKRVAEGTQALSRLPDGRGGIQRPHPLPVPRDVRRRRFRRRHGASRRRRRCPTARSSACCTGSRRAPRPRPRKARSSHQAASSVRGDRVKVKDGTFAGMEGEVKELLEAKGQRARRVDDLRPARAGRTGILAGGASVIYEHGSASECGFEALAGACVLVSSMS